jgi:tetratricopeptide (TPR) repeat protein
MRKAKNYLPLALALAIWLAPKLSTTQPPDIELPKKQEKWIRVQSEHFTIYSNDEEKVARLAVANLERLRKTLASQTNVEAVNSPVPTSIFLFKDDKSFRPYTMPAHNGVSSLTGYFFSRPDGNYIAINAEERAAQIVYHEYIHFFVNNNLPDVPLWFNEGLAEYYSTFESKEDKTKIGLPVAHHLTFLKQQKPVSKLPAPIPLDQLLEKSDILHEEEAKIGSFYAQSWLLVHYLMQGQERRLLPRLSRYLILLTQGHPRSQSFREAFEMDAAQLQQQLEQYLRRFRFSYTEIDSKDLAVVAQAQVAPLPYEDVLFHLGDLLAHQGPERSDEAAGHFNQAISVNPNYALGYAGLGFVEMNRGGITAARQYFGKAIALVPPHPEIYYHYGNCLMDGIKSRVKVNLHDPGVQKTLLDARSAFRAAIDLDGEFVEAYAALGETFVHEVVNPPDEGITALDFALKRLPSRRDIALNLLFLCAQNGDSTKVAVLLDKVFSSQGNSSLLAEAQLATTALDRATQLFEQNKTRAALSILDRIQSVTQDRQQLQQIDQIRQAARYNYYVHLYKSASTRAANKEFDEALELLNQIIAACDNSKLRESAIHAAKQVRHNQQVGWYNQAVALTKNKQYDQAVQWLDRIVAAPADPKLAMTAQEALAHIRRIQKQRN